MLPYGQGRLQMLARDPMLVPYDVKSAFAAALRKPSGVELLVGRRRRCHKLPSSQVWLELHCTLAYIT